MKRLPFYALVGFFILLYTHGLWSRLGVPKFALEAALLALPVAILVAQGGFLRKPAPGFLFIWFYVGWSMAACIHNDEGILRGLLYSRYLVTSYLVFWAVWSSRFTHRQLRRIDTVIFALFFAQVAAALFYWLVLGQRREWVVGTMMYGGGGVATVFPIFAFSCLLAFFLYYNRLVLLAAAFSFFAVSHASGKLGVYYFIPLMLVAGVVLYAIAEGVPSAVRRSRVMVLASICALPLLVSLLSHTQRGETAGMQHEVGLYHKIAAFLNYSVREQTALESRSWYTTSRLSTSKRVIDETFQRDPSVFLFGQGPSVLQDMSGQADQGAYDKYGIIYGTVGWSGDALSVGWPAMFAHVGFYSYLLYHLLRNSRRQALGPYGKAVLLTVDLGFLVFLLSYFLYAPSFTVGTWVSSVYLYFLALMLIPRYREMMAADQPDAQRPFGAGGAYESLCRPRHSRLAPSGGAHGGSEGMFPECT
ncbi:MAG: hypothetical protein M1376_07150 [Planctomycetes bacterium]|nr:hypothetical protein [Planctomycetota bacterium]